MRGQRSKSTTAIGGNGWGSFLSKFITKQAAKSLAKSAAKSVAKSAANGAVSAGSEALTKKNHWRTTETKKASCKSV